MSQQMRLSNSRHGSSDTDHDLVPNLLPNCEAQDAFQEKVLLCLKKIPTENAILISLCQYAEFHLL